MKMFQSPPTSFLIGELFAQQTLLAVLSAGGPIGHVHAWGATNGGSNGAMFSGVNRAWTDDNIQDPGFFTHSKNLRKHEELWGNPKSFPQKEILFSLDPQISSRQYGQDWKMPSSWVLEGRDLSPESLPSGRTARLRRAPAAHWAASWPLIFLFYYNLWA